MSSLEDASAQDLLAKMIGLDLYIVRNELLAEPQDLGPHLKDHLVYMIGLEKSGKLFASGPTFSDESTMTGEGLTIIRADSFEEAKELADQDPFVKAGIRRGHVQKWRVNEGRFSFTVDFSDRSATAS